MWIEKNTLASLTDRSDTTPALVKATPRGVITPTRLSRTCCWVTLNPPLLLLTSGGDT